MQIMGLDLWMVIVLGFSIAVVVGAMIFGSRPDAEEKMQNMVKRAQPKKSSENTFNEADLKNLRETAEDFLEFDNIDKGMISFKDDPNYYSMAFGVHGVNISMYSAQDRMALKSGFTNILNTLTDETQFLVQSRYIDLNKNFDYFKPVVDASKNEREIMLDRIKNEKSEPIKRKLIIKSERINQRVNYANHIMDFFKFYTKESDCIYIKIFVVVNHRTKGNKWINKKSKTDEAYNAILNKAKILRDQFESIGLKTYQINSVQTANIMYSTLLKDESSYTKLEDAIENGLLDMAVETLPGQPIGNENYNKYEDNYAYPYYVDEAAAAKDDYDE